MKFYVKILLLLLPLFSFCQGKSSPHKDFPKVEFSFKSPNEITIPSEIKIGDFYQIVVKDINLNRYMVSLNASDTTYSKAIDFPTFGSIDLSSLPSLVSSITTSVIADSDEEVIDSIAVMAKIDNFKENTFAKKSLVFDNIFMLKGLKAKETDTKKELIDKQLAVNVLKALEYATDLKIVKADIEEKEFDYMETRVLRKTIENNSDNKINVKSDLKYFKELRLKLKELKVMVEKSQEKSNKFVKNTEGIKAYLKDPKNISLKESFEKSEAELNLVFTKLNKVIETISSKNIELMLTSVINLYDTKVYTSLPIQFNGEEAEVEMFFIPKDSTSNLQKYSLFPIKFPQKKYYWSVGTSIYYAGIKSERVSFVTTVVDETTAKTQVFQEDSTRGELGTALLLRAGKKFSENFGTHILAGTGVSLSEEILPRAMLGFGVSYGQKHNFTFDFGVITGNTKRISKSIDFNTEYSEKPEAFINYLDVNFFIGVGYSFKL